MWIKESNDERPSEGEKVKVKDNVVSMFFSSALIDGWWWKWKNSEVTDHTYTVQSSLWVLEHIQGHVTFYPAR